MTRSNHFNKTFCSGNRIWNIVDQILLDLPGGTIAVDFDAEIFNICRHNVSHISLPLIILYKNSDLVPSVSLLLTLRTRFGLDFSEESTLLRRQMI